MKIAAALTALLLSAPLFAQDREMERLKEEQARALKQLDQRFQAEREKIRRQFEARIQSLTKEKKPADRPAAFERIARVLDELSRRVASLEQRLARLESLFRKEPPRREPRKRDPAPDSRRR